MSIWNLSKGEIFFSGKITLYQNGVSKVWDGKYNLDSLDSFANQFIERNRGKRFVNRDRYTLWPNYKGESRSDEGFVAKMLEDIPPNFSPQKDSPDCYEFIQGKPFIIKNNRVKVFTNTAIVKNDFASILKAAKTIMSSFFSEDSPLGLTFIKNSICMDSIDVSDVTMGDESNFDIELTKFEANSMIFSFTILFELEIQSDLYIKLIDIIQDQAGAHKIYNLDFLLMYFGQACFHPENTLLDKENHLYFRQPKDSHEQDLIYSARIIESLSRSDWACKKEDSLFFWMVKYMYKSLEELEKEKKKFKCSYEQKKAVSDYIKEYGHNGKISKTILMKNLKDAISISPLDFVDDKNYFIASYARMIISEGST